MGRRYDVNLNDFYFIGDISQFQNISERYLLTFKKQKNVTLKKTKEKKKEGGRGRRDGQTKLTWSMPSWRTVRILRNLQGGLI